ncbi:MAG: tRNA (N(6)-L-threonylcarbamoyladenosine(37)-C(2))-methylthiotransferase MtaB [Bacilli bacterium]|nr:tRNA (N(6)-L-threonylcarbamoyladenosine(37)-C(2))-methylthiotransferase MtaB [Bacilli bacterium]
MRVGIYSLGCKVNIYESEFVCDKLKSAGYEIVPFDNDADVYIINTCSVTNEADRKSRQIINRAKNRNNNALIVVMGCYSQIKYNDIDADIVIGNKDKSKIVELIEKAINEKTKYKNIYNLREEALFEDMEIKNFANHTRAFVKIQDGCNAFCSYCIIPYTRGKIRSKKFNDVISEVTNLVKNGYKEIVLTGIHTGKYGLDLENVNLESLLKELIKIDGLYRLRLSSIEINEITDGIIELIKNNDVMAKHLHIPLQSGCDNILKAMNRCYDVNYFLKRIDFIRKQIPDISITTDLIVGFPGEDEKDFNDTLNTLKMIKFTKIHTFPYSKRDNTKASMMKNQVSGVIKKNRVKKVLELSSIFEYNYYRQFIGCVFEGVSEVRHDGRLIVHTTNFVPVLLDEKLLNNQIVTIKVVKVDKKNIVYGKINNEDA